MSNLFKDVGLFHEKFGLDNVKDKIQPHSLDHSVYQFRIHFMQEELDEFVDAWANNDLPKMADALVDLVYVALGTAHLMHIPFNDVWDEVQRANMAKVRANGADDPRSTRKHTLDVVKPAGWQPPDVKAVLERFGFK
jgi:predicted HAD superfamily Cof-like phosphohydrolase